MSNNIKKILLIINIVILFVMTGFSAMKEEGYKKLDDYFYLELVPVDPRSLLQGDYMTLNYDITDKARDFIYNRGYTDKKGNNIFSNSEKNEFLNIRKGYIVVQLDENKVAKFLKISKEKTNEKGLIYIAFKRDSFNIDINANSYLFQEGTGDKYQNAKYSKVVLIGNNLKLIDLRGKDFKEIK